MRLFSFLTAFAILTTTGTSGLLPGQDAYAVSRQAITTSSGFSVPARLSIIERPQPGTTIPGVVIVKTKRQYGIARQHGSIIGSPVNADLAAFNVTDVSSMNMNTGDVTLAREIGLDRMYVIRYGSAIDPFDLCARLMDNADVEYAIPMYVHKLFYTPNDPRYSQQPWMSSTKTNLAWDVTKGSANTLIAIIDSGTDWQHQDLASKIWTNPKEIPDNGRDDDANGYVDDVRGWDFVGNISQSDAQQGILRPDNDPRCSGSISDGTAHGTVVGGCAGAATDNNLGVASTGFNCRIIPIKCGSDNPNFGGILQGYNAIVYTADLGAHIINCSWGGPGIDPGAQDIVDYATAKGALVVAASGNDGLNNDSYLQSPASLDNVLSVGSCSTTDRPSNFSNYGMNVDVYAPGEGILSTYPNNQYRGLTGTSFSCPLTAGIAALVKSIHTDWTPEMIAAQLRGSVDQMVGVSASARPLYWGRVNAQQAVLLNASWTSGPRMPGILAQNVTVGTTGRITTLDRTTVSVDLKNVLADAQNVSVTVQLLDPRVRFFGNATTALGSIARNASSKLTFDVQLNANYPWYQGNVPVALTISAGGSYVAFENVSIPIQLTTSNSHQTLAAIASSSWDLVTQSGGTVYATGTVFGTRALLRGTTGGGGLGSVPFTATALTAASSTTVLIGGLNSGTPSVSRSTTSGSSWSTTSVSAFMSSVASIRMYDANNGVAIGNPTGGKFGVARTTSGGAQWAAISGSPTSSSGERVLATAHHGDALWAATSSGRVVSSLNRGQTWALGNLNVSGATIVSIAFRDSSNGLILYRTGVDETSPYRIATSTNGGTSWRAGSADLALGTRPVSVGANTGHHVLIGQNGEVFGSDNNGQDWAVILSLPSGTVLSTTCQTTDRPTIFFAGSAVCMLQYRYAGPNGTKVPVFSTAQVGFGTLEPGQSRSRTATLRNLGTSDLTVSSYATVSNGSTPEGAFTITGDPRTVVPAGGSITIGLRCSATDTGSYQGVLRVVCDGTPSTIELPLFALVSPATSVDEDLLALGHIMASPLPAATSVHITLGAPSQISLFSTDGRLVYRADTDAMGHTIDVSALTPGMYHMIIVHGMAVRTLPIVIAR